MKQNFEDEIKNIVANKLSAHEMEQLTYFFKQAVTHAMDQDDDDFYKEMTSEMTGSVKDLALVLIDFRKDFKLKIRPHIEDIAINYIPQTSRISWRGLLKPRNRRPIPSWITLIAWAR